MSSSANSKPMITDVFVNGAIQGWNIATHSTIPNVLMAFVIIRILDVSGLLALIGTGLGPIMGLFGLPGEAATILLGGWMSMGGGGGVAVALFDKGAVNGQELAICIPAIYLMGSQVQYMVRSLGVIGIQGADMPKIPAVPPIIAICFLFAMNLFVFGSYFGVIDANSVFV